MQILERLVKASSPAKVNLILRTARPLEEGGYHPLFTVFEAVDLRETVALCPRTDSCNTVRTVGAFTSVDIDLSSLDGPQHLAVKAVSSLQEWARERGKETSGVDIEVTKRVPIAGGMAGGSADAAAALVAANELWGLGATRSELAEIGAKLGADVPYGLWGLDALGKRYGDLITPLEVTPGRHIWVFAILRAQISTPKLFARLDLKQNLPDKVPDQLSAAEREAIFSPHPQDLAKIMRNDLQETTIAMVPAVGEVIEIAQKAGALRALVSGSGPSVACLCVNSEAAAAVKVAVETHPLVEAGIIVSGPAAGARIEEG